MQRTFLIRAKIREDNVGQSFLILLILVSALDQIPAKITQQQYIDFQYRTLLDPTVEERNKGPMVFTTAF